MSAKSTHSVTRETALQIIHSRIAFMCDKQLSDTLETAVGSCFHNFYIVTQVDLEKDRARGFPVIADAEEVPEQNEYSNG